MTAAGEAVVVDTVAAEVDMAVMTVAVATSAVMMLAVGAVMTATPRGAVLTSVAMNPAAPTRGEPTPMVNGTMGDSVMVTLTVKP